MSVNVSDHTGQLWLSCFDETGRMIMGMSADALQEIKEDDDKKLGEIFSEATCKTWNWKCKAKMDSFQEQQRYDFKSLIKRIRLTVLRVRYQVSYASPLNFTIESAKLVELIKLYNFD